jgi:hypothetical protein
VDQSCSDASQSREKQTEEDRGIRQEIFEYEVNRDVGSRSRTHLENRVTSIHEWW